METEESPSSELEDLQKEMQTSKLYLKKASNLAVIIAAQARKRKRTATISGKPNP